MTLNLILDSILSVVIPLVIFGMVVFWHGTRNNGSGNGSGSGESITQLAFYFVIVAFLYTVMLIFQITKGDFVGLGLNAISFGIAAGTFALFLLSVRFMLIVDDSTLMTLLTTISTMTIGVVTVGGVLGATRWGLSLIPWDVPERLTTFYLIPILLHAVFSTVTHAILESNEILFINSGVQVPLLKWLAVAELPRALAIHSMVEYYMRVIRRTG